MSSPAKAIAQLLEDSSISLGTVGTNIFIGHEPAMPDNCITIFDTGGFESTPNYSYERPTVMVKVRNLSYDTGYDLAQDVHDALNGLCDVIEGSYRYIGIWVLSGPNSIGRDDNNRALFTINFRLHRTNTASSS